jgi:hypothetical protein
MWLQLMLPAASLLVGHLLLTTKRFLVTERGKLKSDQESAESNRMLGLAFQGQGQLDMAFDKFRKCPLDDAVMDNLYNLGLDFERKRQFNKAQSVYEYMADTTRSSATSNRSCRARNRCPRQSCSEVPRARPMRHAFVEGGQVEKPMLGRYQVEKELGKGAMGVVYLGKDPKIGRVVAIKTWRCPRSSRPTNWEVKERFFREAETAGRLNHPHIVTIYDAGEEHDLAYIAMEFLKGQDLVPQTKPGALLPLPKVDICAQRGRGARLRARTTSCIATSSRRTSCMTPDERSGQGDGLRHRPHHRFVQDQDGHGARNAVSYMSPEQLAGKKIDGRPTCSRSASCCISSCAATAVPGRFDGPADVQDCQRAHPDIRDMRPDVPPCLSAIIDRALCKRRWISPLPERNGHDLRMAA